MRRILTWALWVLIIVAVIGAAYFAWQYLSQDETQEPEQVTLVCSQECAERGQCGEAQGGNDAAVVLGGKDAPAVEANQHDVVFLAGSRANVQSSMEATLIDNDGREFTQSFSRVEALNPMGDIAETGWVAEWCIERE
jgi:uncharacterized low-complexity protein